MDPVNLQDELQQLKRKLETESRIERSLECIRSRTLEMKSSSELAEISRLLDMEVRNLGIKTWGCAFHIYRENDSIEWFSNEEGIVSDGSIRPRENVFLRYFKAGQRGEKLLVEEYKGKKCVEHYEYLCTLPGVGEDLLKIKESGGSFPTFQVDHIAFFKYGYLMFITFQPVPEAHDIFVRFARVFEQTYTRFLDLQNAEARARDAEIEAALEKVRSSTMAMQKSKDLGQVASAMFQQMRLLGGDMFAFGIVLCDKHPTMVEQWHSIGEAGMLTPFFVPIDLDYIHRYRFDQWKAGVEVFSIEIPEDYIVEHFELMYALPSVQTVLEDMKKRGVRS